MSTPEAVRNILKNLPPDVSLREVANALYIIADSRGEIVSEPAPSLETQTAEERAEFIAGVEAALAELDRGEGIPIEQVRKDLRAWHKA